MDPNANLREQREIAKRLLAEDTTTPNQRLAQFAEHVEALELAKRVTDGERLAELVQALDGWILGGGFLPDNWEIARNRGK
jgi:hypothetical protein